MSQANAFHLTSVSATPDAPRVAAVAKLRELADRLERGELHGARVQWRHGDQEIETVEMDGKQVRFNRIAATPPKVTTLDAREVPPEATKAELLAYIDELVGEIERLQAERS